MIFTKIPWIALAGLLLILVLSYSADVSQLRVDELRVHKAEKKMEQIIQQPHGNPVFQAGMITDTKMVLETAKRGQHIDQLEAWFHLIVLVAGAALLVYKLVKR
jgi:hypothetical protein